MRFLEREMTELEELKVEINRLVKEMGAMDGR
jgi:hypothetical protein